MKKIFYNISDAVHINNISEILILFEYFEICIRVTGALDGFPDYYYKKFSLI